MSSFPTQTTSERVDDLPLILHWLKQMGVVEQIDQQLKEQWQLEQGFHRFKRGQLPALPMFLQNPERIVGLMFLLSVALRLFILMEFVVHQQLQTLHPFLDGLYAGNPKRKTERPSAEQLLSAFGEIPLDFLKDGTIEISPLTPLQQRILALMRVPLSLYQLARPSQ